MKSKRNSNLEILRIISMLMIIAFHYVAHSVEGNWFLLKQSVSFNWLITLIIGNWGQVGVNLFLIISSYFLIKKNEVKSRKIIDIILKVMFYCTILGAIGLYLNIFSFKNFVLEVITPFYQQYWFITAYLVFYILSPYLKIFVENIPKNMLIKLLIILSFLVGVYNLFYNSFGGDLLGIIYIYLLIYYFENYFSSFDKNNAKKLLYTTLILTVLALIFINMLGDYKLFYSKEIITKIGRKFNIISIILSLLLFYIFKNKEPIYSKAINTIAKSTLGIYILHENILWKLQPNVLLYNILLKADKVYDKPSFAINYILSITVIFSVFCVIDIVYEKTIYNYIIKKNKTINKICNDFDYWYNPKRKEVVNK